MGRFHSIQIDTAAMLVHKTKGDHNIPLLNVHQHDVSDVRWNPSKGESFVTSLFKLWFISIPSLVSYWAVKWSVVNNDRVLKDKFCQKILVQ